MTTQCLKYYQTSLEPPITDSLEEQKCMGIGLNFEEWKDYWINSNKNPVGCPELYRRKIYSGNGSTFDPIKFNNVEAQFRYIFSVYFSNSDSEKGQHLLSTSGSPGYDPFQDILISVCSDGPQFGLQGACQLSARDMCTFCNADEITKNNTDVIKLCGCQVSSLGNNYPDVPPGCDPLCVQEQVVKNIDPLTGVIENCNQSVCVLNSLSIAVSNATIGQASFKQVCKQCTQGCRCIIDKSVLNTFGITDINFHQYCDPGSVCLNIDTSGNKTFSECEFKQPEPETFNFEIPIIIWILFIFILIIIILIGCSLLYSSEIKLKNK